MCDDVIISSALITVIKSRFKMYEVAFNQSFLTHDKTAYHTLDRFCAPWLVDYSRCKKPYRMGSDVGSVI